MPEPVALAPLPDASEPSVPVADEPAPVPPVVDAPLLVAPPPSTMVVLLLAETTRVRVVLPVPGTRTVLMPVPTAGMVAGMPTEVSAAGCEVTCAGWLGMSVAGAGCPVTTPSELVMVRKEVCGKSSPEDCAVLDPTFRLVWCGIGWRTYGLGEGSGREGGDEDGSAHFGGGLMGIKDLELVERMDGELVIDLSDGMDTMSGSEWTGRAGEEVCSRWRRVSFYFARRGFTSFGALPWRHPWPGNEAPQPIIAEPVPASALRRLWR